MTENFMEVLNAITGGLGYSTLVGLSLVAIARFIPNEKLRNFGYKFGVTVSLAGAARFGIVWEKVEDFFVNSFGQLLQGFKEGLQADDAGTPKQPSSNDGNTDANSI